ncbi:hypothetical protein [Clostridium pasteurianum]|uniref:hypothetical protein n=1 Tax=Clostridium pasteurianum TaxID=1501 RepID=UPI0005A273CC|nr:hypothetical protein [Clostridium pasteurianum]
MRIEMQEEIGEIQRKTGVTTVSVTHDQEETMSISDNIIVMNSGKIQQYSSGVFVIYHLFKSFEMSFYPMTTIRNTPNALCESDSHKI